MFATNAAVADLQEEEAFAWRHEASLPLPGLMLLQDFSTSARQACAHSPTESPKLMVWAAAGCVMKDEAVKQSARQIVLNLIPSLH
ncbi:hypothetical protein [Mesorhizobium sp. L-8-3]|uniref:hypothetical protein n=1 Tax=Mesorhizobium sp. L-8-3 TaxID=2744522 RepID=UPI001927D7DD|nr:hypothetical protein [Mesorhizobium sp. L-8-3]